MAVQQETGSETGFKTRIHEHSMAFMTVLGIGVCMLMAAPFVPPMIWAFSFAVLFAPVQTWLEKKVHRPAFAAAISTAVIAIIILGPLAFVGGQLISEGKTAAEAIQKAVESGEWEKILEERPEFAPVRPWIEQNIDLKALVNNAGQWMGEIAAAFVAGSFMQILSFVIMFYVLFYFLRDRDKALQSARSYLPLRRNETDRLFRRIGDTIYASVYGTIAVAAIQGALGGLMFWWLGLPGALLWGTVMALLAIVPVLGAFFVWIPAAVFLALDGSWGKALILTGWGTIIIGGIDNVLYPILVGNRLKLHTIPAFIAIVGGLALFGGSGIILGPVVLTITLELIEIWRKRTEEALREE